MLLQSTLQSRQAQVGELIATARLWQSGLDSLQATVQRILLEIHKPGPCSSSNGAASAPSSNGSETWIAALLDLSLHMPVLRSLFLTDQLRSQPGVPGLHQAVHAGFHHGWAGEEVIQAS